jgi:hypothetical protein
MAIEAPQPQRKREKESVEKAFFFYFLSVSVASLWHNGCSNVACSDSGRSGRRLAPAFSPSTSSRGSGNYYSYSPGLTSRMKFRT